MPFIVCKVLSCEEIAGKEKLKKLQLDVGSSSNITVVTNAPNVRLETRTVVATIGTEIEFNGEVEVVKKTALCGIQSEGVICDSAMLGWVGGAVGIAVQIPSTFGKLH
jgi:tRNA-binding EMAP/Myf-like protein